MSNIYLWEIPESYPNKLIGIYNQELSPSYFLFMGGVRLSAAEVPNKPIITFEIDKSRLASLDCLVNSSGVPVVSDRLAKLLINLAADDIQLFDVTIECPDGELKGYKLVNVTQMIKGIDHELSIYKKMKDCDIILTIKHLVYKAGCMAKYKIVRDKECITNLLVNQEISEAFKKEKISGVRIITPEEYYG